MAEVVLHSSWKKYLGKEFEQDYMRDLKAFLHRRKSSGAKIYPPSKDIFAALDQTPFDQVKVVILGQDPYHGPGQAHGFAFSVQKGLRLPPSLQNIFKEIKATVGGEIPSDGDLRYLARQGVLLLNSVLTVEQASPASHQNQGWERFTDRIIQLLNERHPHLVFMLWGSYAQKKADCVDPQRHLVLKAPHPSPLSAHRGFMGCGHFAKANRQLAAWGQRPIDWFPTPIIY